MFCFRSLVNSFVNYYLFDIGESHFVILCLFKAPFLFHPPLLRSYQPQQTFPLWQVLDVQFDLLRIFEERYLSNYQSWVLICSLFMYLGKDCEFHQGASLIYSFLCEFEEPYSELLVCLLGIPAHCWLDLHVVYAIGYMFRKIMVLILPWMWISAVAGI